MNVTNSLQQELQQQQHSNSNTARVETEEESVVTSTSNDLSHSSPSHVQQQQLQQPNIDSTITSPARITSSTGNDCSISPCLRQRQLQQQHHQQREQQQQVRPSPHQEPPTATAAFKSLALTVDGSSEDDSRSQHEFASSVLTQKQQQQQQQGPGQGVNVAATTVMPAKSTETSAATNSVGPISPSILNPTLSEGNGMVARNLSAPAISDSAECGNAVVDNVQPAEAPANQKIILKLPRPSATAAVTKLSHQMDADATTSNGSSNSSSAAAEDTRKVEPLKINLHNTHSNLAQQHNVPKITIKPIIKKQTEENDASCSSSADDDPPIPKLTIKAASASAQHASSNLGMSEPHILPKLTIRAASGEEGSGAAHSASIVPRLTIKISDLPSSSTSAITHNNSLSAGSCSGSNAGHSLKLPASMRSSACSTPSPPPQKSSEQQVPLPKLTIKTSLDGTSNAIISHISPASLSSSSTSSSSSVSAACTSQPSAAPAIPKFTIKTITKPEELVVPKLTIKTNAAGNSECASITATSSTEVEAPEDAASSKVPKLTIKTGQDAVIITQHSATVHAQSVPKLTIKTKSLDVAEMTSGLTQADHYDEPPPEKIPKITIKTSELLDKGTDAPKFCIKTTSSTESFAQQQQQQQQPTIPKLTITVSNLDCGGNTICSLPGGDRGPQSPLIVRQAASTSRKTTTTTTSNSPERVPKLMISRQDSGCPNSMLVVSNHGGDAAAEDNKVVPKLTIKTSSLPPDTADSKEPKPTKFSIRTVTSITEEEKVPKLTIKSVAQSAVAVMPQQSSEESDECVSLSSCSPVHLDEGNTNAKVVPKLTIKNLSSPQPMVKTAPTDADRTTSPASKKCAKNSEPKNDISTTENESSENAGDLPQALMAMDVVEETIDEAFAISVVDSKLILPTTNGGESSSSQEFCGFNDNTTDSNIESANLMSLSLHEEEPRRHSDDMDIDEALQQQHAPQVFNNVTHFDSSNGAMVDATSPAPTLQSSETAAAGYLLAPLKHPKLTHVIDTVDLTSSPSPSSSPAHFDYTEPDTSEIDQPKATDFLLERLQMRRETSVIQQAAETMSHNIFLNKLTSQSQSRAATRCIPVDASLDDDATENALQPKPESCITTNSSKYPHLAERLLANGIVHAGQTSNSTARALMPPAENVIVDSIEILDTPEGSPRSSLDEESVVRTRPQRMNHVESSRLSVHQLDNCKDVDNHNNNNMVHSNHGNLKRRIVNTSAGNIQEGNHVEHLKILPSKLRRIESDSTTMATITILTNEHQQPTTTVMTTSPTMIQSNHVRDEITASPTIAIASQTPALSVSVHRSRKQKHEHLLTMPPEEQDPLQLNCHDIATVGRPIGASGYFESVSAQILTPNELPGATTTVKRRGRPRKGTKTTTPLATSTQQQQLQQQQQQNNFDSQRAKGDYSPTTPGDEERAVKSRLSRVQLLRKRLAIDMVDTEQPPPILDEQQLDDETLAESTRRDRILRTPLRPSRRSVTPNTLVEGGRGKRNNASEARKLQRKKSVTEASLLQRQHQQQHQHFGGSNSSMSSCSTSSLSSSAAANAVAMAAQIDLTMCSSSSSSGSQTLTTVEAGVGGGGGNRPVNCMLPPTRILSSSDPLADVVFRPNDFSSLVAAQQLRSPIKSRRMSAENANILLTPPSARSRKGSRTDSQDDDADTGGSGADNSGDESASSVTSVATPGRGRGRGRGRSGRGSAGLTRGGGTRPPRLGRGASSVAKAIAMSRPRCVGGLKHMPDPERLKGLFSPAPQVFEEDTRMSADLNPIAQVTETAPPPVSAGSVNRQLDFLTNEESQSSVMSNTSILDPNTIAAVQNGAQPQKRPKKKKMEVCVSEDTELTVASIAEYEWPPPKGCCPSRNRDTFMIQEQVALYLGIKSFKRKYPDLPRRQVDMEERNWLQEKGLVSEKMCDLGITAVWASDILDIMYADFYEKYEEYKEFIRQKHVREIEAKQKALGLNVTGRGMQARDRALHSASKWNTFFNKSRKEERNICMDLQTLTVNVPLPSDAPIKLFSNRSVAEAFTAAVEEISIPDAPSVPPTTNAVSSRPWHSYPLALVPGQYCEKYRHYTPLELRSYPINTVLDDPLTLYERLNHEGPSNLQAGSDTDTESATETAAPTVRTSSYTNEAFGLTPSRASKRIPVRRSRRARTNAIQQSATNATPERARRKSDIENGQEKSVEQPAGDDDDDGGRSSKSDEEKSQDSSTSASDSESLTTSSDTDSDSDSSSCSSADLESCAKCGVCERTQNRNLKNLPEVFLKCYTCRRRVHPSCIEMPYRMTARVRNYNWQCAECKCCIKCKRRQDQNKMLFCEQCDRGFHIYCIDGKSVPEGRWSCDRCSVCMRCGATKPEGLGSAATNLMGSQHLQAKQVKHKKVKWINEYRIDHITKLREHCSMLCVPCGRLKTTNKRNNHYGGGGMGGGGAGGIVLANVYSQMSPPSAPSSAVSTTMAL